MKMAVASKILIRRVNDETTPDIEKKVVGCLEQNIARSISLGERQLGKPSFGAVAAKGNSKGKGRRNCRECEHWITKGQCSSSVRRSLLERGTPTGRSSSGKEKPADMVRHSKVDNF